MTRIAFYISDDDRHIFDGNLRRKPRSYSSPEKGFCLELPEAKKRYSDSRRSEVSASSGSFTAELTRSLSDGVPMCAYCTRIATTETSRIRSNPGGRADEEVYFFKRKSLPVSSERSAWVTLQRKLSSISLNSLSKKRRSGDWCGGSKSPGGTYADVSKSPGGTYAEDSGARSGHAGDVSSISDARVRSFLLSRSELYRRSSAASGVDCGRYPLTRYRSFSSVELLKQRYSGGPTSGRLRSVSFTDKVRPLGDLSILVTLRDSQETNLCTTDL